ncbi:MAG: ABC transporter permease [Christensenellales bacterium]|jgi:putative ABC transport system permease protein|nr:ABC transporter permease [Clostridiales bacterium]
MQQILLGAVSLGLLWSIMTLGVYISYRILDVADLTVEGSITLGAAVCANMITSGNDPVLSLLIAFIGGTAAGLVTGLLHTKLRIPALLSGILTMIALYSVNLRVMGMSNVSLLRMTTAYSKISDWLGVNKTISVIIIGGAAAVGLVFILYWFFGTQIGSAIRATGNNPHMVRAQGINTDTAIIIGLMLANGLVALSGGLIAQSQNYADVQMGTGAIVIGLASLIIGEVLFGKRGFKSRLISMIFGAITYRIIIALVLRMGMPADDLKLFTAITVALALSLPRFRELRDTFKASISGRKRHA